MNDGNNIGGNKFNPVNANDIGKLSKVKVEGQSQQDKGVDQKATAPTGSGQTSNGISPNVKLALMSMNPMFAANFANIKKDDESKFQAVTGHSIDEQLESLNTPEGYEQLEKHAKSKEKPDSGILVLNGPEFDRALEERISKLPTITAEQMDTVKKQTSNLLKFTPSNKSQITEQDLVNLFHSENSNAA